jgi:hypothetical protein
MIVEWINLAVSLANSVALGWLVYSYRCYKRGYVRGITAVATDPVAPAASAVMPSCLPEDSAPVVASITPLRSIATCAGCGKKVARWQTTVTGPQCVNCKPL